MQDLTPFGKPIGILHGYHLDGSGSCIYVRNITREFCRMGVDVVLLCQEPEPEKYDFLNEAYVYPIKGKPETLFKRKNKFRGKGIFIRTSLPHGLLPVYVEGKFLGFENIKTFPRMTNQELQDYIQGNVATLKEVVRKYSIKTLYANHIIMMPYIAYLVKKDLKNLRYFLIPHGSEIEYTIKKDNRYFPLAEEALSHSNGIIFGQSGNDPENFRTLQKFPSLSKKNTSDFHGCGRGFFLLSLENDPRIPIGGVKERDKSATRIEVDSRNLRNLGKNHFVFRKLDSRERGTGSCCSRSPPPPGSS
ncbi:MAG: hypothetical protein O6947_07835 [Acidobacteria bacterium]|nr:hypothetical protein [Acidobacteriota bacterium]